MQRTATVDYTTIRWKYCTPNYFVTLRQLFREASLKYEIKRFQINVTRTHPLCWVLLGIGKYDTPHSQLKFAVTILAKTILRNVEHSPSPNQSPNISLDLIKFYRFSVHYAPSPSYLTTLFQITDFSEIKFRIHDVFTWEYVVRVFSLSKCLCVIASR